MKKPSSNPFSMISSLSNGYRLLLITSAVTTILSIVFNYLMPQVIRFAIDTVLGDQPSALPAVLTSVLMPSEQDTMRNLISCAVMALVFSLLSGLFMYLCRYTMAKASEGMIERLRNRLFSHVQKLSYHWHVTHQTGDIIQRCTSDVEVVRGFLSGQLLEMFRTVFLIILSLVLMFNISVKLSWISTAFVPIVMLYSGVFYAKISKNFRKADEAEGDLSAAAQENFTGVRVVRAFGREAYEIDRFEKKNNLFSSLWIKLGHWLAFYWGIGDFVSAIQVMVVVIFGALEAYTGAITLGDFLLFSAYNSMLVWPVRSLGRILSEMSKTGVSISRLNEILDEPEESDEPDALCPPLDGDIVFDHVSFDYHGINPVLHDINLTIHSGETVGILGATGSGKSTLMYLLDRLYDLPQGCGSIRIGGVDIRNIRRDHLRKHIGFVLQEPFLFSKTIRENIGITSLQNELSAIRHSASVAAVDEAICEFAQGYDTIVGERGVTLSGGQKQRVAIARMLMQETPIMIFDDSLSAVDAETDAKIRAALKNATKKRTTILISHRITTLMNADRIFVMEKGQVVQSGTHETLCKEDGVYRQIYEIQGSLEEELSNISEEVTP